MCYVACLANWLNFNITRAPARAPPGQLQSALPWRLIKQNKMAALSRTVSEASGSHMSDSSNPVTVEALQEFDDELIKETIDQLEYVPKFNKRLCSSSMFRTGKRTRYC